MKIVTLAALAAFSVSLAAHADEACPADMRKAEVDLVRSTKIVAVTTLPVPAGQYVSSEPEALEFVFFLKPEDGPSRVSDDGTVIFFVPGATDQEMRALTRKAFDIRMQRKYGNACH